MRVNPKILAALAAGLTVGGATLQSLDPNRTGADDTLGLAMTSAGGAVASASGAGGVDSTRNTRAADRLDAVADGLKSFAAELRARDADETGAGGGR